MRPLVLVHMALVLLLLPVAYAEEAAEEAPLLVDVAAETGLDFLHQNGRTGELYFHEMMGSGGALFDADGDGDLDVYLVQGGPIGPVRGSGDQPLPSDRLFRNLLRESGELRFADVTAEAGLSGATEYGMGAAVGDVDGDGRPDLYVTNFGSNRLWLNRSDADGIRFVDVTEAAGVADRGWSTSATFFDADGDGRLDLFVAHYVAYGLASHKPCRSHTGRPTYCGPHAFSPEPDVLFRNLGPGEDGPLEDGPLEDGPLEDSVPRFERVGPAPGEAWPAAPGLGVVAADFDRDGRQDLYVANDQAPNQLWMNRSAEDGVRFVDDALFAGAALNAEGRPEAGMGIAVADVDGDLDPDLLVTHLTRETHTLYLNDGNGGFADRTAASGLASSTWEATGFGVAFFDLVASPAGGVDGPDGRLDLFVANGAVKLIEELVQAGDPFPLHQPNQLFHQARGDDSGLHFEEISAENSALGGDVLERSEVSRGVVVGDVDEDGDADLLVTQNGGPARLFLQPGTSEAWIGLRLLAGSGRDALGAEATLLRDDGEPLWRRVDTGGSYLSASDPRILFGLAAGGEPTGVRVRWPGGRVETFSAETLTPGSYVTLREGDGTSREEPKP